MYFFFLKIIFYFILNNFYCHELFKYLAFYYLKIYNKCIKIKIIFKSEILNEKFKQWPIKHNS